MGALMIAVALIGIDSLPIFPTSNVNRPLSSLIVLFATVSLIFTQRLSRATIIVSVLTVTAGIHLLLTSQILFPEGGHLVKAFITMFVFQLQLTFLFTIFDQGLKRNAQEFLSRLGRYAAVGLLLVVTVAMVQILSILSFVPQAFSEELTGIFSYRSVGRIQGVSGEPAAMVRTLGFLLIVTYAFYRGKLRSFLLPAGLLLFFLSGSTYGYVSAMIFVVILMIIYPMGVGYRLKWGLLLLLSVSILALLYSQFFDFYTSAKIDSVLLVLSSPSLEALESVLRTDASIFQRAMNPVIGFLSGPQTFFLGSGLDAYRYLYPSIINEVFPYAADYQMVSVVLIGEGYITPKSMYSRIYAELGLIPFLMFLLYQLWLVLRSRQVLTLSKAPLLLVTLFIVFSISMDSLIYPPYFVTLSFLHCYLRFLEQRQDQVVLSGQQGVLLNDNS